MGAVGGHDRDRQAAARWDRVDGVLEEVARRLARVALVGRAIDDQDAGLVGDLEHEIEAVVAVEVVGADRGREQMPAGLVDQSRQDDRARLAGGDLRDGPRLLLRTLAIDLERHREIACRLGAAVADEDREVGAFARA